MILGLPTLLELPLIMYQTGDISFVEGFPLSINLEILKKSQLGSVFISKSGFIQ